jgi:hypothetical protein
MATTNTLRMQSVMKTLKKQQESLTVQQKIQQDIKAMQSKNQIQAANIKGIALLTNAAMDNKSLIKQSNRETVKIVQQTH